MTDAYDKLIQEHGGLERKGAKVPYTSMNGNMFTFLTDEGRLALRLPKDVRTAYLRQHEEALLRQHGVVMKEYVQVPLRDNEEVRGLFRQSYEYAKSLKPKPTTRKKQA